MKKNKTWFNVRRQALNLAAQQQNCIQRTFYSKIVHTRSKRLLSLRITTIVPSRDQNVLNQKG